MRSRKLPVARKRPAKSAPVSAADKLVAHVRGREFAQAVLIAQTLAKTATTPADVALVRDALLKAAEHYELHGEMDSLRWVVKLADDLPDSIRTAPDADGLLWLSRMIGFMAKAGLRERAGTLDREPINTLHFADYLVRTRSAAEVPAEWKAGYDAVLDAFAMYSNGKDDAAREVLNAVGLSSPFLDWKLLLRGLIAWSTNDDAKAVENFSRLNPMRFPARLAAPVRVQCDPTYTQGTPAAATAAIAEQGKRLRAVGLVGKLNKVRSELARSRTLGPAFKAVEAVLPELAKRAPQLVPKLADVFYFAIIKRGEQPDLAKYRKVFGPPPADPAFHKLEAMVFEEVDDLETSLARWAAFEGWLAEVPAGWSKPLAERARAVVLNRMAGIAADIEEDAADPRAADDFGGFFGAPARKPKAKRKPLDPTTFLKRAADLAPDWEPAARALFAAAVDRDDLPAAEAAARRFLEHHPQSVPVLSELALLMAMQGRTAEALELRRRALATNPLDPHNRHTAASATVAHARRLAIDGELADAEKLLDDTRQLLEAVMPTSSFALRSVLYRKTKRPTEADAAAEAARNQKASRLVARLYLHANAVLLKLKPKEKAAAAKELADALEPMPTPGEAGSLLSGYDMYVHEGLKYTGQKTQEKKLVDVAVRAAESPEGGEAEFELLAGVLQNKKQYAAALKVATALMKRFPKNPLFPLVMAQAEMGKSKGRFGYKVTEPLRKAKALAEASTEERHKQLLPQIEELLKASDPFSGLFGGGFFG